MSINMVDAILRTRIPLAFAGDSIAAFGSGTQG